MNASHARGALLVAAAVLWAADAPADPARRAPAPMASAPAAAPITIRAGDHGAFVRVVYVLPPGRSCGHSQLGDLLILACPDAGAVPGIAAPPPGVLSVSGGVNAAAIGIPQRARAHVWQLDQFVIVDIYRPVRPPVPAPPPSTDGAARDQPPEARGAKLPEETPRPPD